MDISALLSQLGISAENPASYHSDTDWLGDPSSPIISLNPGDNPWDAVERLFSLEGD